MELLQGNEAQTDRFLAAYDAAGELITQLGLVRDRERHKEALRSWDELNQLGETSVPRIPAAPDLMGMWQGNELLLQGGEHAWLLDVTEGSD